MHFELDYSKEAAAQLEQLQLDNGREKQRKAVQKALARMQTALTHPALSTHKMQSLQGPNGEQIFVSYAENRTPSAYRIFWYYDKTRRGVLKIVSICSHL